MRNSLKNISPGEQIKYDLVRQVRSGRLRPGDAVLSERRLADAYKISYLTARKAVGELVERGYLYRLPRRGIFVTEQPPLEDPAFVPAGGRGAGAYDRVIAAVMADLRNEFSASCLEGIEKKAATAGFQTMIFNSALDTTREAKYLQQLAELEVAGVVMIPCFPPINRELVERLRDKGIPVVMADRFFPDLETDFVGVDNFEVGMRAVNYLISLGHRKIAHITGHRNNAGSTSVRERRAGYVAALENAGIEPDPDYIQELDIVSMHTEMSRINLTYLGYAPMQRLLALPEPPTAVFLLFDSVACGAYRAIYESGRSVPEDISLIGVNDDTVAACLKVPLTTMALPVDEFGETAVSLILNRHEHGTVSASEHRLNSSLITRESCRALESRTGKEQARSEHDARRPSLHRKIASSHNAGYVTSVLPGVHS